MILKVIETTGEYAIASADGQKLYEKIHPQLMNGELVQLDFSGVSVFSAAFFNHAIGQLLRDIGRNNLNYLLSVSNLSEYGTKVLRDVIDNAKLYYPLLKRSQHPIHGLSQTLNRFKVPRC